MDSALVALIAGNRNMTSYRYDTESHTCRAFVEIYELSEELLAAL